MKIRLYLNFFAKEFVLFAATMAVALFIAYKHSALGMVPDRIEPVEFSWVTVLTMLVFFLVFTFIITRYQRVADKMFKLFLLLVIFSGGELLSGTFLPFPINSLIGVGLVAFVLLVRNVIAHDIGIGLGIAGISALLGLSMPPTTAAFLLVVLSVYDIIAVYKTKHMVAMAEGMIKSGAIFGFLIPFRWKDFFAGRKEALPGERFMILGSGDIGLPAVLVASVVPESLPAALIVAVFAGLGLFVTHLIFTNQIKRAPMAALPPIATLSIIGYLVSMLVI